MAQLLKCPGRLDDGASDFRLAIIRIEKLLRHAQSQWTSLRKSSVCDGSRRRPPIREMDPVAKTAKSAPTSSADRAIGPTTSKEAARGNTPALLTTPNVGRKAETPQKAAGMRTLPPVSVPSAPERVGHPPRPRRFPLDAPAMRSVPRVEGAWLWCEVSAYISSVGLRLPKDDCAGVAQEPNHSRVSIGPPIENLGAERPANAFDIDIVLQHDRHAIERQGSTLLPRNVDAIGVGEGDLGRRGYHRMDAGRALFDPIEKQRGHLARAHAPARRW